MAVTKVEAQKELLSAMSAQFNNPDFSDVTLIVGKFRFPAHRYVLAMQSPVFRTMLTDGNWGESNQNEINLQELCDDSFKDFLQFLYTGIAKLNEENVFSLYQLSDKYDIHSLNRHCSYFIKSALVYCLEKHNCDALAIVAKHLALVEEYAPSLLPLYLEAIRHNLWNLDDNAYCFALGGRSEVNIYDCIKLEHWKQILGEENGSKVVVISEISLYLILHRWLLHNYGETTERAEQMPKVLKELLPYIRFYNMNANDLNCVKHTAIAKEHKDLIKEHLDHAYQVQAELFAFSVTSPKKRKLSDGKVEHKCNDSNAGCGETCNHVNPRLYVGSPYGKEKHGYTTPDVKIHTCMHVVDLRSLQSYMSIFVKETDKANKKLNRWSFTWSTTNLSNGYVGETFDIYPAERHIDQLVTLVICVHTLERHTKDAFQYTIVKQDVIDSKKFLQWHIHSPKRKLSAEGSIQNKLKVHFAVYVHSKT